MNYEEGRMWTVQGYKDDETVHAYPTVASVLTIHPETMHSWCTAVPTKEHSSPSLTPPRRAEWST